MDAGDILWIILWSRLWINFGRRIFAFGEIPSIVLILGQQPQKVFPALQAQNRITQRAILQLSIEKSDLGDDEGHIIQIDGIIHLAGKRLIHALPVIGHGCTFIGRRCVFQRLKPVGKGLHLLNEEVGVQRSLVYNLFLHNSCLARRSRKALVPMGFSSYYGMPCSSPPGFSGVVDQVPGVRVGWPTAMPVSALPGLFFLRGQVILQPNDFHKAGNDLGPGNVERSTALFPPVVSFVIKGFLAVGSTGNYVGTAAGPIFFFKRRFTCSLVVCGCVMNTWICSLFPAVNPALINTASGSPSMV